ncbi:trypsin, alkaline C isoform X3 [Helicoverpa armigera]|uniref:trypsin, alkaline C isoform X3 n=1 Tax=Helicoverpa armigera TaxID=29058 RepID=UPI003083B777
MRVIAVLALCVAAVAAVPASFERIVGGSLTTIDQYPSIVALLYGRNLINYGQACGGNILNNRSILTAAHCTVNDTPQMWRFRVGSSFASSGGIVHNVQQIIEHPTYNVAARLDNDFAILRSASAIIYNDNVKPIAIAGANYHLADNQPVWAAGWGKTHEFTILGPSSEQLRHVQIYSINQEECRSRYGSAVITDNMVCSGVLDVGRRDQCGGDSGGPLYHNGVLVGVCSFGRGCARRRFPGVNARVSSASAWIVNNA